MFQNPSLNWEKLQNVFYRSRLLHKLEWSSKKNLRYAISLTFIAIETERSIQIFNYIGELLADIDIKLFDPIVSFDFDISDQKSLIVVGLQGFKVVKRWAPLEIESVILSENIQDTIWDYKDNIIILKESKDIYQFDKKSASFDLLIKNDGRYNILTKTQWHCNKNKIIILDTDHVFEVDIDKKTLNIFKETNEWHRVVISRSGFICFYNAKYNKMHVFSESNKVLSEYSLDEVPADIKWCGDDCISCSFEDTIKLFGPDGEYVSFWYSADIFAFRTEIDGLKVFTEKKIYLITKVPSYTANVYRIGSTESGSMLVDACHLLPDHTARAIDYLKNFDVKKGVSECIEAAKEEMGPQLQKELLNAASFGKSMLSYNEFDSNIFVQACDTIKILNILRNMGIFITNTEYQYLGFEVIIDMLLISHKFYECLEICKQFKKYDFITRITEEWASVKIKTSPDVEDADLFKEIQNRLSEIDIKYEIPMAKIAKTSFTEGRFGLARNLALIEKSSELKALSLIELDDYNLAIQESLKSECPGFILSLLLLLKEKLTTLQLTKLLMMSLSHDPIYLYFQRNNYQFLFDFYRQTDKYKELAHCISTHNKSSLIPFLPQIKDLYTSVMDDSLTRQDSYFLERNEDLVTHQEELTSNFGTEFVGLTLDKTLEKLIFINQPKQTKNLIKKFKINEKKYYHITCGILIKEKRFDQLYEFATQKKPPIGYDMFVKYLQKAGQNKEAAKYILLINNMSLEEKIKMLYDINGYFELIQLFTKEKNILELKNLYQKMPVNEVNLRSLIKETISKL